MNKYSISLLLTFLLSFQSCKGQETYDDIINKYDTVNFEKLNDLSIYYRSSGPANSSIIFINRSEGNCSPYIVEVNNESKEISAIKNHLVITSCNTDYLSNSQIASAISIYLKYNFFFIKVTKCGDLYINPHTSEAPVLLKLATDILPSSIKEYRHYRGRWYVRKT